MGSTGTMRRRRSTGDTQRHETQAAKGAETVADGLSHELLKGQHSSSGDASTVELAQASELTSAIAVLGVR